MNTPMTREAADAIYKQLTPEMQLWATADTAYYEAFGHYISVRGTRVKRVEVYPTGTMPGFGWLATPLAILYR